MWEKGKRKERSPGEGEKEVRKNLKLDDMETSFDFCERMTKMMDDYKEKVSTTLAKMDMEDKPTNNDVEGADEDAGERDGRDGLYGDRGGGGDGHHAGGGEE